MSLLLSEFGTQAGGGATPSATSLFREVAARTGLVFHHFTGASGKFYIPEIMGAGVAVFDYDSDGDLDVYFTQGTMLDKSVPPARALFPPLLGFRPGNRLFRNELIPGGTLRFTDVTARAGVGHEGYGMGVAVGDIDNDADLDLYVTNFGSNVLYRNNGDGTFSDVTATTGVDDPRWSTSAAFLDYDRDGDLDLFVTNYVGFTVKGNKKCQGPTGQPDYCTPAAYLQVPDRLFQNGGQGTFVDVSAKSGIGAAAGPGLGVVCADFNGDGFTDLYIANDGAANFLWINQKDGTFEESALIMGAAYSEDGVARAGMGVDGADYDSDGDVDLLVTNLRGEGSTLYRNDGRAGFVDASLEAGLGAATFSFTGFGVGWFDYDNDGLLDLFIANGAVTIQQPQIASRYPFHQKNQLFHNEGAGKKFLETSAIAGPALELSEVSRGAAFGDIDNDGDIDIVVSNNKGPARLLLNETGSRRHWIQIRLEATRGNRFGIGARIGVHRGKDVLWRRVHSDGSYLCASDLRVHFGLGDQSRIDRIEVRWPEGSAETWTSVAADKLVVLRQGSGR